MDEFGLIERLAAGFPRSGDQLNRLFEADAEIVRCGERTLAFTIDEFTQAEDGFSDADPEALGWNLAVATLSDLLAAGASPQFYLQVVCAPVERPPEFLAGVMAGVRAALAESGAFLVGGDLSAGPRWRYTGCAIGTCECAPRMRTTDRERLLLYATGSFGDGNVAALAPGFAGRFESRRALAARVAGLARLGMDTSDGLRQALLTLAKVNPAHRLVARADAPVHPAARAFAERAGLPPAAFLLGSAGEYELVLGVDEPDAAAFERAAGGDVTPLGVLELAGPGEAGLWWSQGARAWRDAVTLPDPRTTRREDYVAAVVAAAAALFGR